LYYLIILRKGGVKMTNVKHAKFVSLDQVSSKFGEGVILDPIRSKNEPGAGGGCCVSRPGGIGGNTCSPTPWQCTGTGQGCGSSNKIKIYR